MDNRKPVRTVRWLAVGIALVSLGSFGLAAGPSLRRHRTDGRYRIRGDDSPRVLFESDGRVFATVPESDLARMKALARGARSGGDGGAATVSDLLAVQTHYLDSTCPAPPGCNNNPCNVVTLLWTLTAAKPSGIRVFEDGVLLGTIDGGSSGVNILGTPAGLHTYRIDAPDNGSSTEATIRVLDSQPFADPANLSCREGAVDGQGTCKLAFDFEGAGPDPDLYGLFLNDAFLGAIDGGLRSFQLDEVPPGEHCVTLNGQLQTPEGIYQGCFVTSCCTLTCAGEACDPPADLLVCQIQYGPGDTDNAVLLAWTNPSGPYAGGLDFSVDGAGAGMLPGDVETAQLGGLSPGVHTFGVRGDCAAAGVSTTTEGEFTIREETPHPNPVSGSVSCEWSDVEGGTTTATWTNADPSIFIDVFVTDGQEIFFLGTIAGDSEDVAVTGTAPTDLIVLQFFANVDGACYGSELIACSLAGAGSYIPGVCSGEDDLNISSGIFLLNFLFLGGDTPGCVAACDCNGDGDANISDASCVFNFLFLGGPAPTGWVDDMPTCVAIGNADCGTPNPACDGG